MRDTLIYLIGAYLSGTVFVVALIELVFTMRRRKANNELQKAIKEMKSHYNQSINKLVLQDDAEINEAEKAAQASTEQLEAQKQALETEHQAKIDELTKESEKALDAAKAKAKKLQEEAKLKADEYMTNRQKEVEEELMDLVLSVTKKVLPEGLTYDIQKELVMHAFKDVQIGSSKEDA